ncbi:YveK family protein [Paenibacillus agricola]|uniref:Lipopolysaccharide biosynthesis protein n=1 Tax=Paenibacillus agricola TaxID=2716264 RepID=A0ABX0J143_9BACL|nr:Wzz/FepE/Etk N-terminal domain-containing protein [Paenibacillus agricola]NHN29403.1 lipopolysaccharide biosynthesis protein [Paenibacillus agricola]
MEFDLKFFLKILRKRAWLIMLVVVIACGVSFYLSEYVLKPTYEASTKLIVNKIEENKGLPALDYNTVNLNIKLIDVYKEIVKSPAIMDIVAAQNPTLGYTSEQLIKKVKISAVPQTPIMMLTFEDGSHENAVKLINSIATVFQRQITSIMKVDNVVILNEAKMIDNPEAISPKVYFNVVVAMATSLIFMISLVIVLEYFNDTVKSEEDIWAQLGIPTLTAIAKVKRKDMKASRAAYSNKKVGGSTHASVL